MRIPALLALSVLVTAGCTESGQSDPKPGATATATSAQAVVAGGTLSGTLREQIPVEPYVYVRLETDNGDVWAAVNQAPLAIGAPVTVYNVMLMEQFASETLKRTFARIYFGSLDSVGGFAGEPQEDLGPPGTSGTSVGAVPAEDANIGPVAKARGADARTIRELWTEKSHLAGATVSIRGVVVKYNPGVMGKNWIHLQDGSGDAARGTHDIAITSLDEAAVGDTVTITGTVRTNRDLGAGYTYELLVEDAKVASSAGSAGR